MPAFDESAFNFNKVKSEEILFEYKHLKIKTLVTCLINASPLTLYHTLICPNLKGNQPQFLTPEAITVALDLLGDFAEKKILDWLQQSRRFLICESLASPFVSYRGRSYD